MSVYLEIPRLNPQFPYRAFLNDGMTIVYPHWHKEIEIIYASRGKVRIGMSGEVFEVSEGEILVIANGEPHYFLASPDSERYVFQFKFRLFDESYLRGTEESLASLFATGESYSRHWPEHLQRRTRELLVELYQLEVENPKGKHYLVLANLSRFIGECYAHLPKKAAEKGNKNPNAIHRKDTLERLNQVFEYIENRYQESISLDEVAKYVGFSPYYFTRFFKKNIGQTFMQFLTEYRINQAKFILAQEEIPMIEVAEKAGFSSVKTFHHVFKEEVGISPLQYQKKMK